MRVRLPDAKRLPPASFGLAVLLAGASFALVLASAGPRLWLIGTSSADVELPREEVVYVRARAVPPGLGTNARPSPPRATAARNDSAGPSRVRASGTVPPAEPPPAGATGTPRPSLLPSASPKKPEPFITLPKPFNPFVPPPEPTARERDSLFGESMRKPRSITSIAEQARAKRDSTMRAMGSPGTIPGRRAGDQNQGGGVGGAVGVSFLSPGPSRAERARDSSANAGFLDVLSRLKARAKLKADSLHADSLRRNPSP